MTVINPETDTNETLIIAEQFPADIMSPDYVDWLKPAEARAEDKEMKRNGAVDLVRFFCFIGRRGHKAMGLTFEEYCQSREISPSTGYRHLLVVKIGMIRAGLSAQSLLDNMNSPHFVPMHTTGQAAELLWKLKDADLIQKVCERYESKQVVGRAIEHSPVDLKQLGFIVGHFLPKPPTVPVLPSAPSPDSEKVSQLGRLSETQQTPPDADIPPLPRAERADDFSRNKTETPPQPLPARAGDAKQADPDTSADPRDIPEFPSTGVEIDGRPGKIVYYIDSLGFDISVFVTNEQWEKAVVKE